MSRLAPLLVVGEPALVSSGLAPDRHPIMQPLWESCANVRFYQGKVRRLLPASLMFPLRLLTSSAKIRGLHQQQNSDGVRWTWVAAVDTGALYVQRWYGPDAEPIVNGEAGYALHDTSLAKATQVDFVQWGDWTLFNAGRGVIKPKRWDGAAVADIPNAPAGVAMMKKQNQLMLIGTGTAMRGVAWSDADDITVWAPTAENLAGSLTIEELRTPIRGAARLGQNVAVYTEDQMALVYWIGAPFYFGQRVALDGIGVTGKKAVCSDGRLNYGMSRNGAWQADGNEFRYIDHGVLSDYLQREVNWSQSGKIVVARNDVTRCIEFHFPKGTSQENNEAWSFDPSTGGWAPVVAYQAMDERVLLDKPITGASGEVFLLDHNPLALGALSLVTKPLMIDTPEFPGLHVDAKIDEVEIAALRASNVEFRLRNATDIDGVWESTAWQTLSPDMRTYRLPHLPTGTYHKLEFRSTATEWDLDLQGFALWGFVEGIKRDAI